MSVRPKQFDVMFFGKVLEITDSTDRSLIGLKGLVVDETRNTLIILSRTGIRRAVKSSIFFRVDDKTYDGKNYQKNIENRIQR